VIKIDMALTRDIHADRVRRAIVAAILALSRELHISVIAEGVETIQEAVVLRDLGVRLFQGYLLAKPALERLPPIAPGLADEIRASHESSLLERRETALGRRA
jgi:EAL domain-containing protein (putative c-di-GMP-specific phosphodiesterase class I)